MQLTIVAVGKLKEKYLREGVGEYLKRLTPFARVQILEAADERLAEGAPPALVQRVKQTEGERIMALLPPAAYHIALDSRGKLLSSEELAGVFAENSLGGVSRFAVSIGGSVGLSEQVLNAADLHLSFGRLTYPHQLMRLMLVEQLYRAFKINRGEPYHK